MEVSRRKFIQQTLIGSAGLMAMPLVNATTKVAANDTIRLGFIGLGQQAINLTRGFNQIPGVEIVAGADVYGIKRERFEIQLNRFYKENNKSVKVKSYENYKELLDRKDIDAVIIATPDHWHALNTIDACNAGKHIYLEKPITFSIKESIEVEKAVKKNKLIFATGSQQRSDKNFQHAVKLVRENKLGKLENIWASVGPPPTPYDLPEQEIPADLDWKAWLGPMPYVHYNYKLNPIISNNPEIRETYWAMWRYFKETGGGFTCDWGAHNFDIGQWALDMDNSGPKKIIPAGYAGYEYLTYEYANGVRMMNRTFDEKGGKGIKFWGSDGWVAVWRGGIEASDPSLMPANDADASAGLLYESASGHLVNFIESLKGNESPIAPIEAGKRTCQVCILGNISHELGRPVEWDPAKEYFVNDPEAEKMFHREYENGYKL